jgi:hypothetical protein
LFIISFNCRFYFFILLKKKKKKKRGRDTGERGREREIR